MSVLIINIIADGAFGSLFSLRCAESTQTQIKGLGTRQPSSISPQ